MTDAARECSRCKQHKSSEQFYSKRSSKWCRACTCEYQRHYRQKHHQRIVSYQQQWNLEHPEQAAAWNRTYRQRHPDRVRLARLKQKQRKPWMYKAKEIVDHAVRSGKLIRAVFCERCRTTDCILNAHHNDYRQPLVVRWLCHRYHAAVHREMNLVTA